MNDAGKVAIAVAAITTLGSVAVAVIANRERAPADAPASASAPVPATADAGGAVAAAPASPAAGTGVGQPAAPAAALLPAALQGRWTDQFGTAWTMTPDGEGRVVALRGVNGSKRLRGEARPAAEARDWIRFVIFSNEAPLRISCRGSMDGADRLTADCTDEDGGVFGWTLSRA